MSIDGGQRPPDPPPPPLPPPEKVEEPIGSGTWDVSADRQLRDNAEADIKRAQIEEQRVTPDLQGIARTPEERFSA